MTSHPDIFAALAAEFPKGVVKTRAGGGGRQLSYITARIAANRLDEVLGPENWRNRHRLEALPDGTAAVVCTIEIRIDGEWVGKEDAGGFKEMTEKTKSGETVDDDENTVKTAYSDAFKRSAALWGVGRYLYGDGSARFEAPAPSPPKQAPAAVAPPKPSAMDPYIDRWHSFEPIADDKDFESRRSRLLNALITKAIDAGKLAEGAVSVAGSRDRKLCWDAAKRLWDGERLFVRETWDAYLEEKQAQTPEQRKAS